MIASFPMSWRDCCQSRRTRAVRTYQTAATFNNTTPTTIIAANSATTHKG